MATLDTADWPYGGHPLAGHEGSWTDEQYLELPHGESLWIELVDGLVIMSQGAGNLHQRLVMRLSTMLDDQLADSLSALPQVGVRFSDQTILVPDVVVAPFEPDRTFPRADEVALVVEIVGETGRIRDRLWKPALYVGAGIGWFLLIELDPQVELILFRRDDDGSYIEHTRAIRGQRLDISDLGLTIEVDGLLGGR